MLRLTGAKPVDRLARGRIPRTRMSRWALATLVVLFLLGAGAVALARLFGKSGSRASIGVSIIAHWLCPYRLWRFPAGLAVTARCLPTYHSPPFPCILLRRAHRPEPDARGRADGCAAGDDRRDRRGDARLGGPGVREPGRRLHLEAVRSPEPRRNRRAGLRPAAAGPGQRAAPGRARRAAR